MNQSIGGVRWHGSFKPWGQEASGKAGMYQHTDNTNPYAYRAGQALGFGAAMYKNWETIAPVLDAGAEFIAPYMMAAAAIA